MFVAMYKNNDSQLHALYFIELPKIESQYIYGSNHVRIWMAKLLNNIYVYLVELC